MTYSTTIGFKISDGHVNILEGMYITRINGRPKDSDIYAQTDSVPDGPMSPLITSLQDWQPFNIRCQKEKEKKGVGQNQHTLLHTFSYTFRRNRHHQVDLTPNHSHVQWNRPHVSTRLLIRLYNPVPWTIKTLL
jgi:hypothetical protein